MYNLPEKTVLNQKLTKELIYANCNVDNKTKQLIVSQVESMYWLAKFTDKTLNVEKSQSVEEIQVIKIVLRQKECDNKILSTLRKAMPYNLLFMLEFEEETKMVVFHSKFIESDWAPTSKIKIELKGLSLEAVWENLITQVGNIEIEQGCSLDEQIASNEQKAKLEKEIARLEKQARAEKQPKKKFELVQMIKKLKVGEKG